MIYLLCSHFQHQMLSDLSYLLSNLNNNDLHYLEGLKGYFKSDFSLRWTESEQNMTQPRSQTAGCKSQP